MKREVIEWCSLLTQSFNNVVKKPFIDLNTSPEAVAKTLYHHPSIILSHKFYDVPRFCFANAAAQNLFGYSWDEFIGMESSKSAEAEAQEDREKLLARANKHGFIDDYSGVRITKDGSRFRISNVTLWNIFDRAQNKVGQAAIFSDVNPLNPPKGPSSYQKNR